MSAITAFFERLAATDHDPRFDKVQGSIRFDIRDGDQVQRWRLDIDHGRLRVRQDDGPAGTVIKVSAQVAESMALGEMNGLAGITRGAILVDGDLSLALRVGKLFPSQVEARQGAQAAPTKVTG
ncbi:SCP2 sterol-binding domain-containing protein [Micromonospora sp. NPDC000663]|uniref:SCP2 sterol-binding domain-containing protein n=1 Tax=Micromonospora sp. NPDC000663 TaxID=3364218 RepID=UPI0036AEBDAB